MDAVAEAREMMPPSGPIVPILPLKLEDVGLRRAGHDLLNGVSLSFAGRGLTVVLGPNGAGKTLLLKTCHGLIAPTSGSVRWAHADACRDPAAQAMVFQRPVLLRRSVRANVDYVLRACSVAAAHRPQRIDAALRLAGLFALAGRPARVLSGGEQQRLALARAWAIHPQVLFLDEPTSNLDPSATLLIEGMIRSIQAAGTKLIMTTHDLGQARRLADEVVFLQHGRVAESGAAAAFFQQPETEDAGAFLEGRLLW